VSGTDRERAEEQFPATPTGAARFRMQVQATHKANEAREAAHIVAGALVDARAHLASALGYHLT